ncbi:MAG: hypothetical protein ACRDNZ_21290 [Streptosporangiaceae bacterium]
MGYLTRKAERVAVKGGKKHAGGVLRAFAVLMFLCWPDIFASARWLLRSGEDIMVLRLLGVRLRAERIG